MSSPLTVRNLTSTAICLQRVERFEDPNTLQSKAHGYFFNSRNTTSAVPTSPELSEHAQRFNNQDLEVTLQPFESYTLSFPTPAQSSNAATLSSPMLRITIQVAGTERHRIDTNPSYTQKSTQAFTALCVNPSATYKAIFHPSKPIPHLAIHNHHSPSYSSWMAALPDNLPLSAISIPGTHNSHTHYRALPSVRCQVHDIKTQLENGIRFLDIRVQPTHATDLSKKDLYLVHGAFPISLSGPKYLEPILQTCYDFLSTNPSETVLISLKREGVGSATDEHLAQLLEKHYITPNPSLWYTQNSIPYLHSVRGKLVLIRRYTTSTSPSPEKAGLDATAWPHNAHHALFPSPSPSISPLTPTFCLQDYCEVLVPTLIPTKLQHCNDHLVRSARALHPIPGLTTDAANPVPPGPLYLNFLSGSNFWKKACWPSAIAKVVNRGMEMWLCSGHHLEEAVAGRTRDPGESQGGGEGDVGLVKRVGSGDGSTGVVIMDCVGENGDWDLVRLVVGMNMGVLSKCHSSTDC
ncbi:1-phosphatidylinositol phosphodiesterase [Curvularia clavata]|uniref:1-phosphatidylinositol phosphodiesterase n=1 Tax=Curvularia clavata TaxID=95742 RepID=A0A9Q9DNU9_CURCL|nr:1-phosphatidylinositol phosphodiesterase [Curvularia clavata]